MTDIPTTTEPLELNAGETLAYMVDAATIFIENKLPWILVVYRTLPEEVTYLEPIHMVGYPRPPKSEDINLLKDELSTDKAHGLTHFDPEKDYWMEYYKCEDVIDTFS